MMPNNQGQARHQGFIDGYHLREKSVQFIGDKELRETYLDYYRQGEERRKQQIPSTDIDITCDGEKTNES